jgi:probable rRNA maturation factor
MEIDIFFYNLTEVKRLPYKKIKNVLLAVAEGEAIKNATIDITFIDDNKIREINNQFLGHDYSTDVVSLELDNESIDGDIFISLDTARKQAMEYHVSFTNELMRLSVHGLLHLIGYNDADESSSARMHAVESKYIGLDKGLRTLSND